jgi:hypothetical protein
VEIMPPPGVTQAPSDPISATASAVFNPACFAMGSSLDLSRCQIDWFSAQTMRFASLKV